MIAASERPYLWCAGKHSFSGDEALRMTPLMRAVGKGPYNEYCPECYPIASEGRVAVSFSNGAEFRGFLSGCFECRHYIDDLDDPKPGRLTPPFNTCAWGVLDRIYADMVEVLRPHSRFHDPEDIECSVKQGVRCKRFTHKDDRDGELRDPPPLDCPGQMMLGEDCAPVERVPLTVEKETLSHA